LAQQFLLTDHQIYILSDYAFQKLGLEADSEISV